MLINGNQVSAELIDRQISTVVVESLTDWLPSAVEGSLLNQFYDYKSIRLTFLFKDGNEDGAYKSISALTAELKECDIRFDDINLDFHCYLTGSTEPIRLQNGVFKVVYLLKNDWGTGELQHVTFDVDPVNYTELTVRYIENWKPVMTWYQNCFDADEQERKIVEVVVPVEESVRQASAYSCDNYDSFVSACGIDLQAYLPNACKLGYVRASADYTPYDALHLSPIDIIYDRYSKDGFQDFPDGNYPSLVNTTGASNNYYIDLGVGQGINIQDLSIIATGRWFESNGGMMIGADDETYFASGFTNPDAYFYLGDSAHPQTYSFKVVNADTHTAHDIVIETLESIEQLPLRKYGFRSSNRGKAPNKGYIDLIFNGVTLDRVPVESHILTNNLTLFRGNGSQGTWCDLARVQVYEGDTLILDAIPMAGHLKNCYINTEFENGWWDMLSQSYLPWVDVTGVKHAPDFPIILPLDGGEPPAPPEPPTPPEPEPPATRQILNYGGMSLSDIDGDISADKAKSWTGDDAPTALIGFTAVMSQPGETGTWSIYSTSYMRIAERGILNDGRAYCVIDVTTSTSKSGQYIQWTSSAGNLKQTFNIKSLF